MSHSLCHRKFILFYLMFYFLCSSFVKNSNYCQSVFILAKIIAPIFQKNFNKCKREFINRRILETQKIFTMRIIDSKFLFRLGIQKFSIFPNFFFKNFVLWILNKPMIGQSSDGKTRNLSRLSWTWVKRALRSIPLGLVYHTDYYTQYNTQYYTSV